MSRVIFFLPCRLFLQRRYSATGSPEKIKVAARDKEGKARKKWIASEGQREIYHAAHITYRGIQYINIILLRPYIEYISDIHRNIKRCALISAMRTDVHVTLENMEEKHGKIYFFVCKLISF